MAVKQRRPPKTWIRRCIAKVKRAGRRLRTSAGTVCGANWYHKMSPASRRAAKRKYPN